MGPVTIFDKSVFHGFSPDDVALFDHFYRSNLLPLFFVEMIGDLEKKSKGRSPEEVVANLAYKTPTQHCVSNVYHSELCLADLLGDAVRMEGIPIVGGGYEVQAGGKTAQVFKRSPEQQALDLWRRGDFKQVDRLFAKLWRAQLALLDPVQQRQKVQALFGASRFKTLVEAKAFAVTLINRDGKRYRVLKAALELLKIPLAARPLIVARWKAVGGPRLSEFAPFAAHVMVVDLVFALGLGSGLISERASNRVDMAYLYYLPFCEVFTSNDKLHAEIAPLFMTDKQVFVSGDDLKTDMRKLDAHFSQLPAEVLEQGLLSFAAYPPLEGQFLTSALWDRFHPGWREHAANPIEITPELNERIMRDMKPIMDRLKQDKTSGVPAGSVDDADQVIVERQIPLRMGKWRILPPGTKTD